MRYRNPARYTQCELLELRALPSSVSLSSDGFLTIMGSSPQSAIHVTEYDHHMVVQIDTETPLIFEKDEVRYLAGFAPNGEYLAPLEIIFLRSAGDVSLAKPHTQQEDDDCTLLWSQYEDGPSTDSGDDDAFVAIEVDIPVVVANDDDVVSGFSAASEMEDDLLVMAEDEVASVTDPAAFEDVELQEESVNEGFDNALIDIFSNQDDLLINATIL